MGTRAAVVVTGTEVLTGRVTDRNGPWIAEELRRHGVDIGQVVVVGDRPDDLAATLRHLLTRGQRPRHHHRRPRPDRRRPHRPGRRRRAAAARCGWTRPSPSGSRAIVERARRAARLADGPGVHRGGHPQAGAGARGRARCSSRSAPPPGSSCRRRRARPLPRSSCCPARPASCAACGTPRSPPAWSVGPCADGPSCASTRCGCGTPRSPSWRRPCGGTPTSPAGSRSPPACATASSRS